MIHDLFNFCVKILEWIGDITGMGYEMANIVIFGGTFNPIHNAHIEVAKLAKENLSIDEV